MFDNPPLPRITMADLKLLVIDGQHLLHENTRSNFVATMRSLVDDRTVLLINKVDLIPAAELPTGKPLRFLLRSRPPSHTFIS